MKIEYDTVDTRTYPWVGVLSSNGHSTTVFFTAKREGFCIDSTYDQNLIERYSYSWEESEFVPCKVTLDSTI